MAPDTHKRDYVIVGAGAIGGTLAFHLARAGHAVRAIDTDLRHVEAIRHHGVSIVRDGVRDAVRVPIELPNESDIAEASRVLICVKGVGATERAASWVADRLAPDGIAVCIQNGLQVWEVAREVGHDRTIGAFVDFFADVTEPGVIVDGGTGALVIGELDGSSTTRVRDLVDDLQAWGPAQSTTNILGYLWSKLGFSAMLAATALADEPMADLIDRHRTVMLSLTDEVFALARNQKIALERFDGFDPAGLSSTPRARTAAVERLVKWLRGQAKTRSGVWRDIAVHRRETEASGRYEDLICLGESAGIACPHLERLVGMLRELELGRRAMTSANLLELGDGTVSLGER